MPKNRIIGLMEWTVAKTKTKRKKKLPKNFNQMALKMSIFNVLKNAFDFFLLLSQRTTILEIRIPG